MTGISYKVPIRPMPAPKPGEIYDRSNLKDLESMPVRAIVTHPADGASLPAGTRTIALRGASWAGDNKVSQVDISTDHGKHWQRAELAASRNPYDWQRWTAKLSVAPGAIEIWARATDERGVAQPLTPDNWNPHGVGVNPVHRIRVTVAR